MLDYIYTSDYDELSSKDPTEEGQEPSQNIAKVGPAPQVMLHVKMMELGDMYLVDGLSLLASERFAKVLTSETTENILDNIIPEVYALDFNSSKVIRKTVIDYMRKRLAREPLAADVKKSLEQAMTDVPVFIHQLLESFIDSPVLGHCRTCGVEKTVPIKPLQRKCLLCNRGGALELSTCD